MGRGVFTYLISLHTLAAAAAAAEEQVHCIPVAAEGTRILPTLLSGSICYSRHSPAREAGQSCTHCIGGGGGEEREEQNGVHSSPGFLPWEVQFLTQ